LILEKRSPINVPHLLSDVPGEPMVDRGDFAANLVAFICVFLSLRGWNLHIASDDDVDAAIDYLVDFVFRGLGIERVSKRERRAEPDAAVRLADLVTVLSGE
jgi:hypothetical protein